ncbi:MAG: 3-hydroxy-3-methylglutaryl-CoA reductase [Rhodobacterales bacterium 12-64-8]|nr:MAG: 3-hydroxy-3-methylglutaryl-CoA reductase [Rhodobacterales bacterium 12-64-8]OYX51378.1 MAG: 3-hydroxy-3-methylglutaryl-CoA reductase [Alphaproteobacteria bacterium 32-64-14]
MPSAFDATRRMIAAMLQGRTTSDIAKQSRPDTASPLKPWIRPAKRLEATFTAANWKTLLGHSGASEADKAELYDAKAQEQLERYEHNVENYIGTLRLPVGVIGPLRVNGIFAKGDFYVPLATSEAALVASYGRGARLISSVGGATTATLAEGVHRSPGFAFGTTTEAGLFVAWVCENFGLLETAAQATTRHGKLVEISPHVEGDHVYLVFTYTTGDAAGQNMVTIATAAVCAAIEEHSPVKPLHWFVEANFSGDKKASAMSFLSVRGRKVTASVELPGEEIEKQLHTTPRRMEEYWRMSALGGVMSGSIGVQGHYANGLAALYLATGQDAACVAESAVGVTRIEQRDGNKLFVSVTLPNVIVGTVGGGTGLPTQSAGLNILGLKGAGHARAFGEVIAAVCLAGELSIIGALCAHEFASAHKNLARGKA